MPSKGLRQVVMAKLGISTQALTNRIGRLKHRHPMTTEEAICVLAHQAGLPFDRLAGVPFGEAGIACAMLPQGAGAETFWNYRTNRKKLRGLGRRENSFVVHSRRRGLYSCVRTF